MSYSLLRQMFWSDTLSLNKMNKYCGSRLNCSSICKSSSCHAINTDIPDPLLPPLPIVHYFGLVFQATSSIGTELLYVCSN